MSHKYRLHEFANIIGRSNSTLRRWDKEGLLIAKRTISNQRYYDDSDVRKVLQLRDEEAEKKIVVYCRVSSRKQQKDLKSQLDAMRTFCLGRGVAVDQWITEIAGGMNFKRPKFLALVTKILQGEISQLYIAHKDRLTRFGFELIDYLAKQNNCEIIIANQEQLSPEQEMIEDLMAIIHTFSCRIYGLRKYKKMIKSEVKDEKS